VQPGRSLTQPAAQSVSVQEDLARNIPSRLKIPENTDEALLSHEEAGMQPRKDLPVKQKENLLEHFDRQLLRYNKESTLQQPGQHNEQIVEDMINQTLDHPKEQLVQSLSGQSNSEQLEQLRQELKSQLPVLHLLPQLTSTLGYRSSSMIRYLRKILP